MWRQGSELSGTWSEGARAYCDLRSYEDVGGERSALSEPGSKWGTTDPEIAEALFTARLLELQEKRRGGAGAPQRRSTTLAELVRDHLLKKHQAGKTSHSHMLDLEHRLGVAIVYFGVDRDPRTIEPEDVRGWTDVLGKGGKRGPGTQRHYLNALSGAFGRAQEGLFVEPGYNPVAILQEKPSGFRKTEAAFFEVADAALLLEAARVLEAKGRVNATPGLFPIVATFLLTGGRNSEVLGLDLDDVSFDRSLVRFRPNEHRGLKTTTSHRTVPLWPQLRGILSRVGVWRRDASHDGALVHRTRWWHGWRSTEELRSIGRAMWLRGR